MGIWSWVLTDLQSLTWCFLTQIIVWSPGLLFTPLNYSCCWEVLQDYPAYHQMSWSCCTWASLPNASTGFSELQVFFTIETLWDHIHCSVGEHELVCCLVLQEPSTTGQDKKHTKSKSLNQARMDKDSTALIVLGWCFVTQDRKWKGLHFRHKDKLHKLAELFAMKWLISVSKYLSINYNNAIYGVIFPLDLWCYCAHLTHSPTPADLCRNFCSDPNLSALFLPDPHQTEIWENSSVTQLTGAARDPVTLKSSTITLLDLFHSKGEEECFAFTFFLFYIEGNEATFIPIISTI